MKKILALSLACALGVAIYCSLVAGFFWLGNRWFTSQSNYLVMVLMLVLLVVSAAVTGSLVFGLPVYWIYKDQTIYGLKILASTLSWLVVIIGLVFLILVVFRV